MSIDTDNKVSSRTFILYTKSTSSDYKVCARFVHVRFLRLWKVNKERDEGLSANRITRCKQLPFTAAYSKRSYCDDTAVKGSCLHLVRYSIRGQTFHTSTTKTVEQTEHKQSEAMLNILPWKSVSSGSSVTSAHVFVREAALVLAPMSKRPVSQQAWARWHAQRPVLILKITI